jgi:hypothetical protein
LPHLEKHATKSATKKADWQLNLVGDIVAGNRTKLAADTGRTRLEKLSE